MNESGDIYCRLCAQQKLLSDILQSPSDNELWSKVSIKLLRIHAEIDVGDLILPKTICFTCLKSLDDAFQFVNTIEDAQITLKTILSDNSNETSIKIELENEGGGRIITENLNYMDQHSNKILIGTENEYNSDKQLKSEPNTSDDEHSSTSSTKGEVKLKKPRKQKTTKTAASTSSLKLECTWKDYSWKCSLCNEIFQMRSDLTSHAMAQHGRCNTYACIDCNSKRSKLDYFIHHVQKEHKPILTKTCYICFETLASSYYYKSHVAKHYKTKNVCPGCETCFQSSEELYNHKDKYYKCNLKSKPPLDDEETANLTWQDYSWKCVVCEYHFDNSEELIKHSMESHNMCNPFTCIECNTRKFCLDVYIKHIQQQHRKYLTRSCYKCYKQFSTLNKTNKHRSTHKTSKFICNGCNSCFKNADELDIHKKSYFKNALRIAIPKEFEDMSDGLKCRVCNKIYTNKANLNIHLWKHMERDKNIICDICGKLFYDSNSLQLHIYSHQEEQEKPYKCKICNAEFKLHSRLRYHVARHDRTNSFTCDICSKSFCSKEYLSRHIKVHSDDLPFTCTTCNKSFRRKAFLTRHMLQHTGIKSYCCDICQRDFLSWSNYNKHMKRKHNMDMSKKKRDSNGLFVKPVELNENMSEWKKAVSVPLRARKHKKVQEEDSIRDS